MRSPNCRRVAAAAVALALSVTVGACAKSENTPTTNSSASGTTPGGGTVPVATSDATCKDAQGTLNSSGATFPKLYYEEVIASFTDSGIGPNVKLNPYGAGGSGKGKTDLKDGIVQWAGTDSTIKKDDLSGFKGTVLYFPTVAAPITASYNLPDVAKLQLSPSTLAKIFMRKVTTWNDPAVAADNPGVTLPSTAISVVVRSDGSGTSSNFSKYLKVAAPEDFTIDAGDQPKWPDGVAAANGNNGVAQQVKNTTGAIGYVDLSDVKELSLQTASIKNKDGNYVAPTLEGASAAVAGAVVNADLTYDPLNATGPDAYPITAPTYIIVYQDQPSSVGTGVQCWLSYVLNEGQSQAAAVNFAPLPASMQQKAVAQISTIKVG